MENDVYPLRGYTLLGLGDSHSQGRELLIAPKSLSLVSKKVDLMYGLDALPDLMTVMRDCIVVVYQSKLRMFLDQRRLERSCKMCQSCRNVCWDVVEPLRKMMTSVTAIELSSSKLTMPRTVWRLVSIFPACS